MWSGLLILVAAVLVLAAARLSRRLARARAIVFLHPYAHDGGGGERVLWVALQALAPRAARESTPLVVCTGDAHSPDELRRRALERFGVVVPESVLFVRLALRTLVEPKWYPVATLLGQLVGANLLLLEAIVRAPPSLLVDTTGYGFAYALAKFAGVRRLACYVHYPTVTSDMSARVAERVEAHNNAAFVSRSSVLTRLKLQYYAALTALYRASGSHADVVAANGRWTAGHLERLWRREVPIVYPPCDTSALEELALERAPSASLTILSVAQFRPEKDHALQLRAFAMLLERWRRRGRPTKPPTLVLAGAVRHAADAARLDALRELAARLGLRSPEDVRFEPNLERSQLMVELARAEVGLHTMWNEHFGISVVEMMAAGVAVVAHASGGPALDIVGGGRERGLLATTAEEYAAALEMLLLDKDARGRRAAMAAEARAFVSERFSERAFAESFSVLLSTS